MPPADGNLSTPFTRLCTPATRERPAGRLTEGFDTRDLKEAKALLDELSS
jgi:hypothetical protein